MASSPPDLASEKSGLAILSFGQELNLDQWFLGHPDAKGVWIRFAKKGAGVCVFQPYGDHRGIPVNACDTYSVLNPTTA